MNKYPAWVNTLVLVFVMAGILLALPNLYGRAPAVQLANDTPYGLGANVYTGDLEKGRRMASRIRAGTVGVNRYLNAASGAPWTGARESGFPGRLRPIGQPGRVEPRTMYETDLDREREHRGAPPRSEGGSVSVRRPASWCTTIGEAPSHRGSGGCSPTRGTKTSPSSTVDSRRGSALAVD